jgi:hypothetical protein
MKNLFNSIKNFTLFLGLSDSYIINEIPSRRRTGLDSNKNKSK